MIFEVHWIHNYQLVLFDFDGVLVDTEALHFEAYKKMCADRGFSLNWDLPTYARHALSSQSALKEAIYTEFPELKQIEPRWEILYQEKKAAYVSLLQNEQISLMPGAADLLKRLQDASIKHCVVTNTNAVQVALIKAVVPLLNSIPFWVTRDDYVNPKPDPECYRLALKRHSETGDRIIGFEDSPRGLAALLSTSVETIFLTSLFQGEEITVLKRSAARPFEHYDSFVTFCSKREG